MPQKHMQGRDGKKIDRFGFQKAFDRALANETRARDVNAGVLERLEWLIGVFSKEEREELARDVVGSKGRPKKARAIAVSNSAPSASKSRTPTLSATSHRACDGRGCKTCKGTGRESRAKPADGSHSACDGRGCKTCKGAGRESRANATDGARMTASTAA